MSSSSRARTIRWRSFGSMPRGRPRRALRQSRVRAAAAPPPPAPPPSARAPRPAARAAGRARPARRAGTGRCRRRRSGPPRGQQRVDLGVRELRVLTDAERRVDRQEGDQPVLQARALGRRSATPVRISRPAYTCSASAETATGLRPAARSALGERERDLGLAHAGRAEHREHATGRHGPGVNRCGGGHGREYRGPGERPHRVRLLERRRSAGRGDRGGHRCARAPRRRARAISCSSSAAAPTSATATPCSRACTRRSTRASWSAAAPAACSAAGREDEDGGALVVWAASLDGGRAHPFHAESVTGPDGVTVAGLPDISRCPVGDPAPRPVHASRPTARSRRSRARRRARRCSAVSRAPARRTAQSALFLGDRRVGDGAVGVRARGRRAAAVRLAGRRADRAGADGHACRGQRRPRARRPPGARGAARGDRAARAPGARARGRRAAARHRHRRHRARLRARRLPRARDRRRRPGRGHDRRRRPGPGGPGRAPARTRQRLRRPRPAPGPRAAPRRAGRRARPARCSSPATAAAASCSATPTTTSRLVEDELGGAPVGGFFAAGEIGPVGGDNFLHGFTATVAVFAS